MVTLVRAPNPSPMTLTGTNSYVLDCGDGTALVIDPGPVIDRHIGALIETASAQNLKIARIALTHGHPDHALAAPALAAATGASIYAHPRSSIARDFDLPLEAEFAAGSLALQIIDAPGHTFDHVIFYLPAERALFTGDTILGEGTTVIAPPGGAMRPYQHTLQRLAAEFADARTIYGGHGPVVDDPQPKIADYIAHRAMREEQIVAALRDGARTIPDLVRKIYSPQRHALWAAMARQILAHLLALQAEGRVVARARKQGLSPEEYAMLNPDLEAIVGPGEATALAAEIGAEMRLESLDEYTLA
ncbi:MAG TPA: MBL fold metallo-hydrolase [Candidatus Cybelea sp.]|nr:MBL fold metallo-hydrolase [Candidatus Cybelea sp.]